MGLTVERWLKNHLVLMRKNKPSRPCIITPIVLRYEQITAFEFDFSPAGFFYRVVYDPVFLGNPKAFWVGNTQAYLY